MSLEEKALIFDFDGVLADTEPLYWRAWASLLEAHGLSLSWEEYCRFGRGVKDKQMLEALPQLAPHPSILVSLKEQEARRKEMVRSWCSQESLVSPSTIHTLKSLREYKIGLVTSSERNDVEPLLRKADIHECFQAMVFGGDVDRHKPDPEPYRKIRERLGIQTGIAFEDSDAGMLSAAAAGFTVIRIPHPAELSEIVSKTLDFH